MRLLYQISVLDEICTGNQSQYADSVSTKFLLGNRLLSTPTDIIQFLLDEAKPILSLALKVDDQFREASENKSEDQTQNITLFGCVMRHFPTIFR